MISEREKYSACYQDPRYHLGKARAARVWRDIEAMEAGTRYLDVGCGRGETIEYARARNVEAFGVELVPELCDGQIVVNGEITALPFEDGAFQIVSCYDVVEHLPVEQVDGALDQLFRVAAGAVLITTNDKPSVFKGFELHLTRRPREWWEEKLHARARSITFSPYGSDEWHWRCAV